ncbi:MAG: DUF3404 domain-containing protein [Pseudobdellovibrio sp.]
MSFAAGFLTLSVQQDSQVKTTAKNDANKIKKDFLAKEKPFAVLKSLSFALSDDFNALFDPTQIYPQSQNYDYKMIQALYKYSKSCSSNLINKINQSYGPLQKAWTLEKFKCGLIKVLPELFFEVPPYMHPFGSSYVMLSLQMSQFSLRPITWIQTHKQYLHLSELKSIDDLILSPDWQVLKGLTEVGQQALFNQDEFILDKNFVLFGIKQSSDLVLNEETNSYIAFSRSNWNQFVKNTVLLPALITETNSRCAFQEYSICWIENKETLFRRFKSVSLFILITSLVLALFSGGLAVKKFRKQKHEEERKRFALQALTHELRTPIASLILNSETLLDKFDKIPNDLQNQILRMCNDIQKLNRLTEISKQYLFAHSEKNFIKFNFQKIESINSYIQDVLDPYSDQISYQLLKDDSALTLDPHWVAICIKNLVENALQHGEKPVHLKLIKLDSFFEISVLDAGMQSLNKSTKNRGLGLGLSIVNRIVTEMKGQLLINEKPTRFTIKLKVI